ncbi:MAG: hypothetical protein QOI41_4412 [Myxococcales bacterium]|jgi:hypothetical protein|nr:hypothetical protein [Myxococcales bacterium]
MVLGAKFGVRLGVAVVAAMLAACASPPDDGGAGGDVGGNGMGSDPAAPTAVTPGNPADPAAAGGDPTRGDAPTDADPDADADPNAPSPSDDPTLPAATQAQLVKAFAPRLHLHSDDTTRPANVDWYLSRVSMRYNHPNCPDHEILALGKVTQAALGVQSHPDDKSFCQHDGSDVRKSGSDEGFFIQVANHATYDGAPRSEWKTYVVWRPKAAGLVDIEYWAFYAYNDGFLTFNHEADWEHVTVSIDPKGNDAQGKALKVFFSAHKGGTTLNVGDPKLEMDGNHPISYVAKGTHANYSKPGQYTIPGIPLGVAKDDAKAAAPADVWKTEGTTVLVGTRTAPKNNQVFVKYWGRWGQIGANSETSGITRHFP